MGTRRRYVAARNIGTADELAKLAKDAARARMRLLSKDVKNTGSDGRASGTPPGNLDHVVAADHLVFRQRSGHDAKVRGWPKGRRSLDTTPGSEPAPTMAFSILK